MTIVRIAALAASLAVLAAVPTAAASERSKKVAPKPRPPGPPPKFSHILHVTNNERTCRNCHVAAGPQAPKVLREACSECHDPIPTYTPNSRPKVGIAFRHPPHVAAVACLGCHADHLEPPGAEPKAVMDRRRCADCHAERGLDRVEAGCEACHGKDQKKVEPKSHTASWIKRHGEESRDRDFAAHGEDCGLCHRDQTCVKCHRERRPESHTGLWRVRLHGVAAEWDRDGCKACHETGVCTRCHRTTRPMNHTGGWTQTHGLAAGTTDAGACRVCHGASFCAACHRPGM